jgi:hypothetical protein
VRASTSILMAMLDRGVRTGEDDFKRMTRRVVMGYAVPSLYVCGAMFMYSSSLNIVRGLRAQKRRFRKNVYSEE